MRRQCAWEVRECGGWNGFVKSSRFLRLDFEAFGVLLFLIPRDLGIGMRWKILGGTFEFGNQVSGISSSRQ